MNIDELKEVVVSLRNLADDNGFDYETKVSDWMFSVEAEYQTYYGLEEDNWGFVEGNKDGEKCDGCKKDGSFNDDDSPLLYGQDWDNKIYCDDCIPKWWEEKIESEVK